MSKVLSVLILSLAATSAANAFETVSPRAQHQAANHESLRGDGPATTSKDTTSAVAAPEIDPASAMSALTLLAGGLVVLRGRRFAPKRK